MANEDQLKILKQGVKVWNQWREEHRNETINLSKTILRDADLSGADLSGADLSGADLRGAAFLRGADLRRTDLRRADLSEVDLCGADLRGAYLRKAYLSFVFLCGADLRGADLHNAHFIEADLTGAALCDTNLGRASLYQATITGVCLYNTGRDDWMIEGIICDYVFWDEKPYFSKFSKESKEQERQWEIDHRTPKDRDFRPGEFEELYKHLPTFDYYFKHGFTALDAVVMSRIVEAINEKHPKFELDLVSFDKRGQPHAKFTVLHKEYIEEAKSHVTTDYEGSLAEIRDKQEEMMKILKMVSSKQYSITAGGDVVITNIQDIHMTGDNQQLAIGKDIEQKQEERSISPGRDYVEHVEGDVTTGDSTQGTEAKDMSQLNTKEECMAHYKLLSEKLFELQQAYILETDTEVKFKLKKHIEKYEADLKEIERRLEELESKEDNTQQA